MPRCLPAPAANRGAGGGGGRAAAARHQLFSLPAAPGAAAREAHALLSKSRESRGQRLCGRARAAPAPHGPRVWAHVSAAIAAATAGAAGVPTAAAAPVPGCHAAPPAACKTPLPPACCAALRLQALQLGCRDRWGAVRAVAAGLPSRARPAAQRRRGLGAAGAVRHGARPGSAQALLLERLLCVRCCCCCCCLCGLVVAGWVCASVLRPCVRYAAALGHALCSSTPGSPALAAPPLLFLQTACTAATRAIRWQRLGWRRRERGWAAGGAAAGWRFIPGPQSAQ